jgi:hypothetical protein
VKTVKRIMPALIVALAVLLGSIARAMEAPQFDKMSKDDHGTAEILDARGQPEQAKKMRRVWVDSQK